MFQLMAFKPMHFRFKNKLLNNIKPTNIRFLTNSFKMVQIYLLFMKSRSLFFVFSFPSVDFFTTKRHSANSIILCWSYLPKSAVAFQTVKQRYIIFLFLKIDGKGLRRSNDTHHSTKLLICFYPSLFVMPLHLC
jgi:hypothetical protein